MKNELNKNITSLDVRVNTESNQPSLYQVLLHNDDFTSMDFVVAVLEKYFFFSRRRATELMLEAHMKGKAACGMFSKDVAETKVSDVIDYARANEQPLVCSMEAA